MTDPDWKPIVTAPRNPDIRLLLWCPAHQTMHIGYWSGGRQDTFETRDQYLRFYDLLDPSHWAEAPPPPV